MITQGIQRLIERMRCNGILNTDNYAELSSPLLWALYIGFSNMQYNGRFGKHRVEVLQCTSEFKHKAWLLITINLDAPEGVDKHFVSSVDATMGHLMPMFSCEDYIASRRTHVLTQGEPLLINLWKHYSSFWEAL